MRQNNDLERLTLLKVTIEFLNVPDRLNNQPCLKVAAFEIIFRLTLQFLCKSIQKDIGLQLGIANFSNQS